jgi:uncharacterized OB-fold protein
MEVRIVAENELEVCKCDECGSDNVFFPNHADCADCAEWRRLLQDYRDSKEA